MQQTGFASLPERPPSVPPASTPKKRAPRRVSIDEVCPGDLQALFGRNLQIARLRQAMTLEDVASATGLAAPYVSRVEHGRKNLTLSTMKKLAAAVKLEPADMLRPLDPGGGASPPRSEE